MLYGILKPLTAGLCRLYFRLEAHGTDNVPRTGPVLLVANHSSVLDPPVIGALLHRQMAFLAKAELFRIPLFGELIRRLNARPVRREGADANALRTVLRVLADKQVLLTFPEGTRGEEGVLRAPKPGAGMLAVLSGAPVVPVYVSGSGRAWPRGRRIPRPAKIIVRFGPPLTFPRPEGGDRRSYYETVSRAMMAAIEELQAGKGRSADESSGITCGRSRQPLKYIPGRNGQHGNG